MVTRWTLKGEKMYKYLMFDLDGTLVESGDGIVASAKHALSTMGWEMLSEAEYKKFIGPPLFDSFTKFCGMNPGEADRAIEIYREHYESAGYLLAPMYEGVEAMLDELKDKGHTMMVVTSKPAPIAEKIIKKHGLDKYFVNLTGPSHEEKTVHKDVMIKRAFEKNGITDPKSAVMIGDRKFDIEAANKNGVDSIAVMYGYGNREEFERHGATHIVEKCGDIPGVVR